MLSLPSLIDGRRVVEATPVDWNLETLRYADADQTIPWGSEPNVFSKARAAGFNSALIGWFLPYCRFIGADVSSCVWIAQEASGRPAAAMASIGSTFPEKLVDMFRSLPGNSLFGQALSSQRRVETYRALMEHTENAVKDERLGLIFVHFPLPHWPVVYDRRTGTFTNDGRAKTWYLDNLALLDRLVGELRAAMEHSGDWNKMTVIFSADHPFRAAVKLDGKEDSRVPFLVKFPAQNYTLDYSPQFNTVSTSEILLAILRGEMATPNQLAGWLDLHRDTTMVHVDPKSAAGPK